MATDTNKAFWEVNHEGFAQIKKSDDFLHPEMCKVESGYAMTETHYLGFNVPEHDIHGIGYLWYHPNLKTVMGGIAVWQGFKEHPLQSEIWDYVSYMSDDCLKDDLRHYKLENGYEVTTIEPLKSHRIQYQSNDSDSFVDVGLSALCPPALQGTGMHFEQAMKTKGEVRLNGTTYEVNGTTVRDRSWGQLRHEYRVPLPPLAWMNCGINEDLAFNITAFDDPERGAVDWAGQMSLPNNDTLRGGWVYDAGEFSQVVSASKTTVRRKGSLFADRVEMTVVTQSGKTYEITGQSSAGVNWRTWHNMDSNINLMRWECNGVVGHGDYQEFLWPEYVRKFHP